MLEYLLLTFEGTLLLVRLEEEGLLLRDRLRGWVLEGIERLLGLSGAITDWESEGWQARSRLGLGREEESGLVGLGFWLRV